MKKTVGLLWICFFVVGGILAAQESDCDRLFLQAVRDGNISNIKLHLSHSWGNLNAQDGAGKTGLMYAVEAQNRTIIQFLFNPPADANLRNPNNSVINPDIADRAGMTALMHCIRTNNIPLLRFFLQHGEGRINVNHQTDDGTTALHYAAKNGLVAMVEALLAVPSISTTLFDVNGDTAFMFAVKNRNRAMIKAFGESPRFDVLQEPRDGVPPLLRALELGARDIVIQDILIFCRDAILSRDSYGNGPFEYLDGSARYIDSEKESIRDMLTEARNRRKNLR